MRAELCDACHRLSSAAKGSRSSPLPFFPIGDAFCANRRELMTTDSGAEQKLWPNHVTSPNSVIKSDSIVCRHSAEEDNNYEAQEVKEKDSATREMPAKRFRETG
jgi:hypothetical protein